MREHWPRWIKSSLCVYFKAKVDGTSFILEEEQVTTTPRVELRVEGPRYQDHTATDTEIEFDISLLVLTVRSNTDIYNHDRLVGAVAKAMSTSIIMTGDGNYFGCAQRDGDIRIIPWGELDKAPEILQTTIEATYKITL